MRFINFDSAPVAKIFFSVTVRSSSDLLMYMSIISLLFMFAEYISALVQRRCAEFCLKLVLVSDSADVGVVVVSFDGGPESANNSANSEYALLISM